MTFLISLGDQQNNGATLDFIQMPLDVGLQSVIHSASAQAGVLTIAFPTLLDRSYRIQQAPDLRSSFFDVFTELSGDGNDMNVDIPLIGDQGFYRIVLDPN